MVPRFPGFSREGPKAFLRIGTGSQVLSLFLDFAVFRFSRSSQGFQRQPLVPARGGCPGFFIVPRFTGFSREGPKAFLRIGTGSQVLSLFLDFGVPRFSRSPQGFPEVPRGSQSCFTVPRFPRSSQGFQGQPPGPG